MAIVQNHHHKHQQLFVSSASAQQWMIRPDQAHRPIQRQFVKFAYSDIF